MLASIVIAPPAEEPVSVQEAKDHLRVTTDADNAWIAQAISAARLNIEDMLDMAVVTQDRRGWLDTFPDVWIVIDRWPVVSVLSIKYLDPMGVLQTLPADSYRVSQGRKPVTITRAPGKTWPATQSASDAIEITYRAGSAAAAADHRVKLAIMMLVAHWYEARMIGQIDEHVLRQVRAVVSLLRPGVL